MVRSRGSHPEWWDSTGKYASVKAGDDRVAADMVALVRHIFALVNAVFQYKRAVPSASSFTLEAPCSDILLSEKMEAAFGSQESMLDQ